MRHRVVRLMQVGWEAGYRQQHIGNPKDIINPKIINVILDYLAWLKLHRAEKDI